MTDGCLKIRRGASEEEAVRCPSLLVACPMLGGEILRPLNVFSAFLFEIALSETCRDMEIEEDKSLGNTVKIFYSSKHSNRRYPIDSHGVLGSLKISNFSFEKQISAPVQVDVWHIEMEQHSFFAACVLLYTR